MTVAAIDWAGVAVFAVLFGSAAAVVAYWCWDDYRLQRKIRHDECLERTAKLEAELFGGDDA